MSLTKAVPNVREIRALLKICWSEATAYPASLKSGKQCPSRGQCFVTAVLIRKLYGGEIVRGKINKEQHYWNKIDGVEIDFTSDQYGGNGYHPITGLFGKVSKTKGTLNKRYKKLVKTWNKLKSKQGLWQSG